MAYRRRYFPALTITTVSYAEKSVTTDKIADKAVTTPKVADDAITSEQIVDETIKSEDIKAGEVKTTDLASGAVTTEKIADQAVTVSKLESAIQGIARPLTPGVATAEIADLAVTEGKLAANSVATAKIKDGNVNAAKLAVDSVESAKIKDGAVSTAKIAGGAVDATKIGVDAVTGSEIQNGAVSASKLAVNAVETVKVKDANITLDKLAPNSVNASKIIGDAVTDEKLNVDALVRRHLSSKAFRLHNHFEEFGGLGFSGKWQSVGDAGGYWLPNTAGGIALFTGDVSGNGQRLDWSTYGIGKPADSGPVMDVALAKRTPAFPNTYQTNLIGLYKDADNQITFYAHDDAGVAASWFARCIVGGVKTEVDTGINIVSALQRLRIEYVSLFLVKFYIENELRAEITTNIPSNVDMGPRLELITRRAGYHYVWINSVSILGQRW